MSAQVVVGISLGPLLADRVEKWNPLGEEVGE